MEWIGFYWNKDVKAIDCQNYHWILTVLFSVDHIFVPEVVAQWIVY